MMGILSAGKYLYLYLCFVIQGPSQYIMEMKGEKRCKAG